MDTEGASLDVHGFAIRHARQPFNLYPMFNIINANGEKLYFTKYAYTHDDYTEAISAEFMADDDPRIGTPIPVGDHRYKVQAVKATNRTQAHDFMRKFGIKPEDVEIVFA